MIQVLILPIEGGVGPQPLGLSHGLDLEEFSVKIFALIMW